jgi:hypothetical protein
MRTILTALILSMFAVGCSTKKPDNEWLYKSADAFNAYTQNFLRGNDALAKNYLAQSIKYAKDGSSINTLAKIHLSSCAINIASGMDDKCLAYEEIAPLATDKTLPPYFELITKKKFYKELTTKYSQELFSIKEKSTLYLMASLNKSNLSKEDMIRLVDISSYNGDKIISLFWLNELAKQTTDQNEKLKLQKTIKLIKD